MPRVESGHCGAEPEVLVPPTPVTSLTPGGTVWVGRAPPLRTQASGVCAHPETHPLLPPAWQAQKGCPPHKAPTADSLHLGQTWQRLLLLVQSCLGCQMGLWFRRGGGEARARTRMRTCSAFPLFLPPPLLTTLHSKPRAGVVTYTPPHPRHPGLPGSTPAPPFLTPPCSSPGIPSSFLSKTDEHWHYQERQL